MCARVAAFRGVTARDPMRMSAWVGVRPTSVSTSAIHPWEFAAGRKTHVECPDCVAEGRDVAAHQIHIRRQRHSPGLEIDFGVRCHGLTPKSRSLP